MGTGPSAYTFVVFFINIIHFSIAHTTQDREKVSLPGEVRVPVFIENQVNSNVKETVMRGVLN